MDVPVKKIKQKKTKKKPRTTTTKKPPIYIIYNFTIEG